METDELGFFYMSTTQKNYELKRVFLSPGIDNSLKS